MKVEPFYSKVSNKAVLLLHAYTGSSNDVRALARRLEREGFSVYCPMFSGHGTMEPMDILDQTADTWWQDAKRAVEFLKEEGHEKIAVFGLSMGGLFAMKLIETFPEMFVGGGTFSSPLDPADTTNIYPNFLKYCEYRYDKLNVSLEEKTDKIDSIKAPLERQLKDINLTVHSVYEGLPKIEKQLFLAQSAKDEMVRAKGVYEAAKDMEKAFVEVHWYPNSTHVITVSHDKIQFEKDVVQFIHKLSWE
ncbi:alpha/beta hydrolase [Vagococcus sp. JNUCC 83]